MTFRFRCLTVLCGLVAVLPRVAAARNNVTPFVQRHCVECHDTETKKGGLDLTSLSLDPASPKNFATWVTVYDRVGSGEMPPKKKARPEAADLRAFTNSLATTLLTADRARIAKEGRATQRRLNRFEYEETLRDLLALPYLEVKSFLPEDPEAYGFNKIGEALDVSHVQMARYLTAAEHALRQAMAPQANRPETATNKFYTWGEPQFSGKIKLEGPLNRRTFPLVGLELQRDLMAQQRPRTSPADDAERRETESMAVVVSTYEPTEIRFGGFRAPVAGKYRLKFTGRSIWMGPTFTNVTAGRQSEPVTIYADTPPRLLRKLGSFDFNPEPTTRELEVWLLAGETIRPDAARLFRSRPPDHKNPLATPEGMPGVAFASMETIGPIVEQWPPASHQTLFGSLPLTNRSEAVVASANTDSNRPRQRFRPPPGVEVVSAKPEQDAEKLLRVFMRRAYRGPVRDVEVERFAGVVRGALKAGHSFTEAMLAGYTGVLSSPSFLYFNEQPGRLEDRAVAERLAYFLWNSAPDDELRQLATRGQLHRPETLRQQTERLLNDPRSRRFVDAFLAYWLDLRTIAGAAPDEELYPDYQLDDLLSESMVAETELFFAELLKRNLPARNVVASDFAMLNERLARHYGIADVAGVNLRPVPLSADSIRGGLLTSASVLKVTANGTSTSPVKRGAWIMTRILGKPPAPPPPSVAAVEPDIRGATTIREQLAKHRDAESCAACHRHIDPAGFALENFDVMGGWRERYRSVGGAEKVKGIGHNGNYYHFSLGLPVDATGELPDGRKFRDVRELKQLLVKDEEQLARNLTRQLAIYATGAPIGFADRIAVEKILARSKASGYGTRQLVHELVQSDLFLNK